MKCIRIFSWPCHVLAFACWPRPFVRKRRAYSGYCNELGVAHLLSRPPANFLKTLLRYEVNLTAKILAAQPAWPSTLPAGPCCTPSTLLSGFLDRSERVVVAPLCVIQAHQHRCRRMIRRKAREKIQRTDTPLLNLVNRFSFTASSVRVTSVMFLSKSPAGTSRTYRWWSSDN